MSMVIHAYYYQCQGGGMAVTGMKENDFVIYTKRFSIKLSCSMRRNGMTLFFKSNIFLFY